MKLARRIYERERDRNNEKDVMGRLEMISGLAFKKLSIDQRFDYAATDASNRIVAYIEIKCRDMKWGQYPDIVLSYSKYLAGLALSKMAPAYYIVRVNNGNLYSYKFDAANQPLIPELGGRTKNRRDAQDVEQVVKIPIEYFKKITGGVKI